MAENHLPSDAEATAQMSTAPIFDDQFIDADTMFANFPSTAWSAPLDWDMLNSGNTMFAERGSALHVPFVEINTAEQIPMNMHAQSDWTPFGNDGAAMDWDIANGSRIEDADLTGPQISLNHAGVANHLVGVEHSVHGSVLSPSVDPVRLAKPAATTITIKPTAYACEEDWEEHRPLITKLYSEMTLRKLMKIMKDEQHFTAT